jgi:hypothetical protein
VVIFFPCAGKLSFIPPEYGIDFRSGEATTYSAATESQPKTCTELVVFLSPAFDTMYSLNV